MCFVVKLYITDAPNDMTSPRLADLMKAAFPDVGFANAYANGIEGDGDQMQCNGSGSVTFTDWKGAQEALNLYVSDPFCFFCFVFSSRIVCPYTRSYPLCNGSIMIKSALCTCY